jgi:predicted permease
VTEIAVSCGLLVAAGLMIRSITNLNNQELGFDPEGVLTGRVILQEADYPDGESRRIFFQELEARLAAEPGVVDVALTSALPGLGASTWALTVDGEVYPTERDVPRANGTVASAGYFETLRIPLLRGRLFTAGDVWEAPEPVAVVNESFSRRILGGRDPLGARVRLGGLDAQGPWIRVVGVVADAHVGGGVGGLGDDTRRVEHIYLTPSTRGVQSLAAVLRTEGDPNALAPRLRSVVTGLDGNLPVYELSALPEAMEEATWAFGLFGSLFTVFGLAALFMASVGLYGVMAFSVERRRQEIGVRMALGAEPGRILRMVLGEGLQQLALGAGLGLVLGYVLAKPLSVVTYGVTLADPFIYLFIVGTLGVVGVVACMVPARTATHADPVSAMREA